MEARLLFTGFLLAFCAVVLADRVHGLSGRILAALGWSRPAASLAGLASAAGAADWYVFFSRAAITGETPKCRCPRTSAAPTRQPCRDRRARLRA